MPIEDPAKEHSRRVYVQKIISQQLEERLDSARDLEKSRLAVRLFLSTSKIDYHIRRTLKKLGRNFKFTKIEKDRIPMAGHFIPLYRPAFVVEHRGLIGFTKPIEYPGLEYSFHIELDEVIISLNLCLDLDDQVIAFISFTHRNGRTHKIDRESSLVNPTDDELLPWLDLELYDFLPSKELFEIVMMEDSHKSTEDSKFD